MNFRTTIAMAVFLAAMATSEVDASTLSLDGAPTAVKSVGEPVTLSISGSPGKPQFLLFDLFPGPTQLFGQSLPLGFSPFVTVVNFGLVPPSGTLALPIVTPPIAGLDSLTVHLLAVVADPAAPFGLDFSNGATLTILTPPTAGNSRATLVGRKVTLFSSGLANSVGALVPGASVTWTLQQAPVGSTATLGHPTQPFTTLTPDVPGEYLVTAQIVKNGHAFAPTTTVRAYRVDFPTLQNGGILPLDSAFDFVVEGPPGFDVILDGVPALPGPGGVFGPFPIDFSSGAQLAKDFVITIKDLDGKEVSTIATYFLGQAISFGSGAVKSLLARLNESGLDMASEVVEAGMQNVDIKSSLVSLPVVELVDQPGPFGGTVFSAYADVTNVTYDLPMSLSQNAVSGGLATTLTIQDLKVTVKVTGEIANIPYSVTGVASADPAIFTGTIALGPNGTALSGSFSGHSVNLSSFSLSLPGFPGTSSQLGTIGSELKTFIANKIKDFLASNIATKVKNMFAVLIPDFVFSPSTGVSLDLNSTFSGVTHSSGGVSFQMNSVCLAPNPKAGAPMLTQFLGNLTSPPSIPATGPLGAAYDFAFSTADDYYNAVLAAATRAGFLTGEVTELLSGSGGTVSLTAGQLDAAFPEAGFDHFDPGLGVIAVFHATRGPVARPTPGGGPLTVRCVGVEVDFLIATSYAQLPILRVALDTDHGIELGVDPDATLAVESMISNATLVVIDGIQDLDPGDVSQVIQFAKESVGTVVGQVLESLKPPSFASVGALLLGVATDGLGTAKEYWTQFCDFLPFG